MFRRLRERRKDEATRERYRETRLSSTDFIWPVFLTSHDAAKIEIPSLPGVYRYGLSRLLEDLAPLVERGLSALLLFGVPRAKGIEQAWAPDGIVQRSIPAVRGRYPALEIITDACLCSYSADGHCHVGDNDATCAILARIAESHAAAGASAVAPSAMMDGQVRYIDQALKRAGRRRTRIIPYSAKYASALYGPFREAADCRPRHGDRKTYQMDPANREEAMLEIDADQEEGADALIIKPALPYLDVMCEARRRTTLPLYAYHVSGEYVMVRSLVESGHAAEDLIWEVLLSIKRAGAQRIISYFTPYLLERLHEREGSS